MTGAGAGPDAPSRRAATIVLVLALAYAAVVAIAAQVPARDLGHDEAVYAVGARGLLDGDAADEFPLHRSIGMRVLALPGVIAGGDERAVRLPFALIGFAYLAAVYAIARRYAGAAAAALAVAVQATAPEWQWRAAEALSDVPSALCLLGLAALCGGVARRDAARRDAVPALAAGALAAAACYLRYASAPVVAAILVVAFVIDPPRRRWLAAVAAIGVALLVPFFLWSVTRTGSPLGVLDTGERMARRDYPGHGLVFYLRAWPVRLAGPVMGAVAAIGVVVGIAAWRRSARSGRAAEMDRDNDRDRNEDRDNDHDRIAAVRVRRLFATAALGQLVLLGWRVHGEARFVLFALTALSIVGCGWLAARRRRWHLAVALAALTAIPSAVWTLRRLTHLATSREPFAAAMAVIRADRATHAPTSDAACLVLSTEVPMSTWSTGCRSLQIDGWGLDPARTRGAGLVYLVEAQGLPRSIGGVEAATRDALGWRALACGPRFCVWRATRSPP